MALAADQRRASQIKFCPNRRVIGRIFAFAHFAIDAGRDAFLRQRFAGQDGVDAQAAIFWKGQHSIIPPGENARRLRMKPQRIAQTDFTKLLKGSPLAIGAHDRATPQSRVVNIDIFGRDIEIAAHRKIDIVLFAQAIAQSRIPFQLVFVSGRTDRLTVRRINRIDAQISDRRRNHECQGRRGRRQDHS